MNIYPAIDILNQRAVRLIQGNFEKVTDFGPAKDVAREIKKYDLLRIHVVDLGAVKDAKSPDFALIEEIVKELEPIRVQLGGGLRSVELIEKAFEIGVERVIVSTRALRDPDFLKTITSIFGPKILVGLDLKDGFIQTHGWQESSKEKVEDKIRYLNDLDIGAFVVTDTLKDGMLSSPSFSLMEHLAKISKHPLIVSGGISSIEDILHIIEIEEKWGNLEGAIIGMSYHMKKFDLRKAIELCAQ